MHPQTCTSTLHAMSSTVGPGHTPQLLHAPVALPARTSVRLRQLLQTSVLQWLSWKGVDRAVTSPISCTHDAPDPAQAALTCAGASRGTGTCKATAEAVMQGQLCVRACVGLLTPEWAAGRQGRRCWSLSCAQAAARQALPAHDLQWEQRPDQQQSCLFVGHRLLAWMAEY